MASNVDKFDDDIEQEIEEVEDDIDLDDEIDETTDGDVDESQMYIPKWRRSNCPQNSVGHNPIIDKTAAKFGRTVYKCEHCGKTNWTGSELEFIADKLLRENSNAELCRICVDEHNKSKYKCSLGLLSSQDIDLPYGKETGHTEWQLQVDDYGEAVLNEQDETIYVGYPELICDKGHRWYKGEGPRRNINGKDPILFESHLYNRKRREIYPVEGVPDPAYTMDRWGKRPTVGVYNRSHPEGRKTNSESQRRKGSGYYR